MGYPRVGCCAPRGALGSGANAGVYDIFVAKLSGADGTVLWTKQFGTVGSDVAEAMHVAMDGTLIVAGATGGDLGGDGSAGSNDGFVMKLDSDGTELWTRQFGTGGADFAYGVHVHAGDKVLVTGHTAGDLGGKGSAGGVDAYLMRLSGVDGTILGIDQFGTSSTDEAYSVTADADGRALLVGRTEADLIPDGNVGGFDAFLTMMTE